MKSQIIVIVILILVVIVSAGFFFLNVHTFHSATQTKSEDGKRPKNLMKKQKHNDDNDDDNPPSLHHKQDAEEEEDSHDSHQHLHHDMKHLLECPHESSHFSLSPEILTPSMKDHLNFMVNKINRNKQKRKFNPLTRKNQTMDEFISTCLSHEGTPECAMWNCLPIGGGVGDSETTSSSSSSSDKQHSIQKNDNNNNNDDVAHYSTPSIALKKCCSEHAALRDTALWVIQKLEEADIRYFLSTGTALGAIRHQGTIIPWDTDVDIAIFPQDAEKVKKLFTQHRHEHYFHKDPNHKKMFWIHHSKNGKPVGGPHVEIFYEPDYTAHPDQLLPLQRCDFYGKNNAWCPKLDMFPIWFGTEWHSYDGTHYHDDHRCTKYFKGKRIEMASCGGDLRHQQEGAKNRNKNKNKKKENPKKEEKEEEE